MSRFERIVLAAAFAAWSALAIAGSMAHEPWWDEAQAWLVAREVPLPELLTRVTRYEGHPPFWFLLLKIPIALGLPYSSMKVLGVLCGAATALLLLYGFPRVPLYVRLIAPFTLFVLYQYTIVARSYVLLGPILLLIARRYDERAEHPWRFFALLIALSHVSVHGFAIACGLALLFVIEKRRLPTGPFALFAINAVLLVAMLWPAPDNISHINHGSPLAISSYRRLATTLVPELFWGPPEHSSPARAVLATLVALIAMTILVFWLLRRRTLAIIILPLIGVTIVSARYFGMWHEGIFFFLLLFASLLAFDRPRTARVLDVAGQVVLVLLLARNAQWAFQSLAHDLVFDFTGSKRAAAFLRERGLHHKKVYGYGIAALELQPYFERNLFDNWTLPAAYFEWSPANPWPYTRGTGESREEQLQWIRRGLSEKPDVIVYAIGLRVDEYEKPLLAARDYRRTGSFRGDTYWKTRPTGPIRFDIYERVIRPSDTPAGSAPHTGAR